MLSAAHFVGQSTQKKKVSQKNERHNNYITKKCKQTRKVFLARLHFLSTMFVRAPCLTN